MTNPYSLLRVIPTVRLIPRPETLIDFDHVVSVSCDTDEKGIAGHANHVYLRSNRSGAGIIVRLDGRIYRLTRDRSGCLVCAFVPDATLMLTRDLVWARVSTNGAPI
jgi:hypothetical protein